MQDELLSVDQVAEIVDLHPRTVRRYIRDGRLKANKLGKQWRVFRRDLDALIGKLPATEQSGAARDVDRIQVSAVVDMRVDDRRQADRIFNSMLAAVIAKGPEYGAVHYESLYLSTERKARLMFWGDAAFIGNALITVDRFASTADNETGGQE